MSGIPVPGKIRLRDKGKLLQLDYPDGASYELSAEYLRVESPSAEVRGHGGQGGELPYGKEEVKIKGIERMGNYALQFIFDDGHDSGIYTWGYLWQLAKEKEQRWRNYLQQLRAKGHVRQADVQVVRLVDPKNIS